MPDGKIMTASGVLFDVFEPKPEQVRIQDIAHALSYLPRFGGHTREMYTVAQHSVLTSSIVMHKLERPEHAMAALLHDAQEAYLIDLPRPIKRHPVIAEFYAETETRVQQVIFEALGVAWPPDPCVAMADEIALATEARSLMPEIPEEDRARGVRFGRDGVEPLAMRVVGMSPWEAHAAFMTRFQELRP